MGSTVNDRGYAPFFSILGNSNYYYKDSMDPVSARGSFIWVLITALSVKAGSLANDAQPHRKAALTLVDALRQNEGPARAMAGLELGNALQDSIGGSMNYGQEAKSGPTEAGLEIGNALQDSIGGSMNYGQEAESGLINSPTDLKAILPVEVDISNLVSNFNVRIQALGGNVTRLGDQLRIIEEENARVQNALKEEVAQGAEKLDTCKKAFGILKEERNKLE